MRYAIIAAGEGSRLAGEGVTLPKPLVRIGGEPLLGRLIRVFLAHDATEVVVVCNERMTAVADYLERVRRQGLGGHQESTRHQQPALRYLVRTTPSSMHSLYALSPWLDDGQPFVATTVDTVFREDDFGAYVRAFRQAVGEGYGGLMGVTRLVDDEKPLYVGTGADMGITGFFDEPHGCDYISAGIYGLTQPCLEVLRGCVARGEHRMRNFQRALVAAGIRLKAWDMGQVLDIDHAPDIGKAERMIGNEPNKEI